jgi:hypothetical protein
LQQNQSHDLSIWQKAQEVYRNSSTKVRILLIVFTYLIISLVILFFAIILNRHVKSRRRNYRKEILDRYQLQLADYLFSEEDQVFEVQGINNPINRQIFIDELRKLHSNLHGETAEKLKNLYFNLGLHKDSLKKIRSSRWDVKSKGFRELSQMDVKDANDEIVKYINAKNPILRVEAQVAMVKLSENNPLNFLTDLSYPLSYWEQINIYDTLIYHQINIDSFESWLDNKNDSIVLFALRMIGLFKHIHSASRVKELLHDENPEKRLVAAQTMEALEVPVYIDDLKNLFIRETNSLKTIIEDAKANNQMNGSEVLSLDDVLPRKIRKASLEAIKPIVTEKDIPFLVEIAKEYQNSYELRLLAIGILMTIKPQGEQAIDEMFSQDIILDSMIINIKKYQES